MRDVNAGLSDLGTMAMVSALSAGVQRFARPALINRAVPTTGIIRFPKLSPDAIISMNGTDRETVRKIVTTFPSLFTTYGESIMKITIERYDMETSRDEVALSMWRFLLRYTV